MAAVTPTFLSPADAVETVEPGRWGVGVSGGADSVALLRLAASRPDLHLHVIHLDHETRGAESTADAAFVRDLACRLQIPATVATRTDVETTLAGTDRGGLPANPSAAYRALRLALFRTTAAAERLQGVLLAHHADDQAETVLLRLLRGAGYPALAAIADRSAVDGIVLRRPLLSVRRSALRSYLQAIGQTWQEDASNATGDYGRNRVRQALASREDLTDVLLAVASRCRLLDAWVRATAPDLQVAFPARSLADPPELLARAAAANWLISQGVPPEELSPAHVSAVVTMCRDAASVSKMDVPGDLRLTRRRGVISAARRS